MGLDTGVVTPRTSRYFAKSGKELDGDYLESLDPVVKIQVNTPINQDGVTLMLTKYLKGKEGDEGAGRDGWLQFFAAGFVWKQYEGFDLLDITETTWPWPKTRIIVPVEERGGWKGGRVA